MEGISRRVSRLRDFLLGNELGPADDFVARYDYLSSIKSIQGNLSNDISYIATLLAKSFLQSRFDLLAWDAAEKPQGAPGLDIDVSTRARERIIGEIKTTVPYGKSDLGSNQKAMFDKDFAKLTRASADHKFMFVTESRTFDLLCLPKYCRKIPGVTVVDLISGREMAA